MFETVGTVYKDLLISNYPFKYLYSTHHRAMLDEHILNNGYYPLFNDYRNSIESTLIIVYLPVLISRVNINLMKCLLS